jgi:hypothetical protein
MTDEEQRRVLLRLGATDHDFRVCHLMPPTAEERAAAREEGWPA